MVMHCEGMVCTTCDFVAQHGPFIKQIGDLKKRKSRIILPELHVSKLVKDIKGKKRTMKVSTASLLDVNLQVAPIVDEYKDLIEMPHRTSIVSSLLNVPRCRICNYEIMTFKELGKCPICATEESVLPTKINGRYLDFFIKSGVEEVAKDYLVLGLKEIAENERKEPSGWVGTGRNINPLAQSTMDDNHGGQSLG
jgi:predicted Zn-ribbon and HTH transcriptional regulator